MSGEPVAVPTTAVQPSQLLVDAAKLRDVLAWFDADEPEAAGAYDPLPCVRPADVSFELPEPAEVLLADGHTRALAAVLAGADRLRVARLSAAEWESLSPAVYETCLEWCLAAGVTEPRDLVGRVVGPETFEREWVDRCRALEAE